LLLLIIDKGLFMLKKLWIGVLLAASLCSRASASLCDQFCHGKGYLGPTLLVQAISANQASFRGLHGRASLGYADWSNKYYMAGELFYIPATMTLSDTRGNAEGPTTKASNSFGASLLPGTLLYKEILGYLRLGLISSRFVAPNSMKLGAQLGFGLQTQVTSQLALRGEYIYTAYGSVAKIGTPNSNEFGVGFIYFFDAATT
jgi:opacity protein-like surface antigen